MSTVRLLSVCVSLCMTVQWGQAKVYFPTEETTLYVEESAVLPFSTDKPLPEAKLWQASIEPADLAEIIKPAQILAEQSLGYIRILPKNAGHGVLKLEDGTTLKLIVQPQLESADQIHWISPVQGAVLEGVVQVGVDLIVANPRIQLWENNPPLLHLAKGEPLSPSRILTDRLPRSVRFVYDVNCSELDAGIQSMIVRWNPMYQDKEAKSSTVAPPASSAVADNSQSIERSVVVLNAFSTRQLETFAAEDLREVRVTIKNREKPQPLPGIDKDDTAVGGQYAALNSGNQTLATLIKVEQPGHYQIFARARGSLSGGGYPSMAIYLGDENNPVTSARTLDTDWHRIPVGQPLFLKAGEHLCSLRFTNDFNAHRVSDRNLNIDEISILRVPDNIQIADKATRTLSVRFRDVFDGKKVQGPVTVEAKADYDGFSKSKQRPPHVSLWINEQKFQSQVSMRPRFTLPPAALKSGENALQFKAVFQGREVTSSVQRIFLDQAELPPATEAASEYVFFPRDPAWDESGENSGKLLTRDKGRYHFNLNSNGEILLNLPPQLAGCYRLYVHADGDTFEGPPLAQISIEQNSASTPLADVEVIKNKEYEVGKIILSPDSPAAVKLAFTNDHYLKDKGDRNLRIFEVLLRPNLSERDEQEPVAAIHYPKSGHKIWREDTVIAEVYDPSGIQSVTLLIDGKSPLPAYRPRTSLGPVVLPILAKDMAPGSHTLALRVLDRKGNETITPEISITVTQDQPAQAGPYHRAVHLLNRLAYGAEPDQMAEILVNGEDVWLEKSLTGNGTSLAAESANHIASELHQSSSDYWVARKALAQAILSQNPAKERFNFWAQNHFSTWIRKAKGDQKWRENLAFHQAGFDRFSRLLNISAHSPAMLVYLDQQRSFAKRINENYAREIMELHTLSVDGHYTQKDVTTLSYLLTGWMTAEEAYLDGRGGRQKTFDFQFDSNLNDPKSAEIIGLSLPEVKTADEAYDRIQMFLETLSRHPDTAHFISNKLAEHYVPLPASPALVASIESTFHRTGGDLAEMMRTLVHHQAFWDSMGEEKLATPLDYSMRIARMLNHYESGSYHGFLQRSGMGLFEKSTPDGYPEEPQAYADSNALLQRWHLAKEIAWNTYNHINQSWQVGNNPAQNGIMLAELTAYSLTGKMLEPRSEQAVTELIKTTDPKKLWSPGLSALILQLPQMQYR